MGMGAEGALGTGAQGGGATTGGEGGGGSGLQGFLQNPENLKLISDLLKHGASIQGTLQKASPEAKSLFQEMAKNVMSRQQQGASGAPGIGSMQPTQGPYVGDIPNYSVDPQISRMVLQNMGIPYGSS